MGQFSGTSSSSRVMFDEASSSRVMFDEEDNNGLVLCDKYLPVEVLIEIFCHADCKTLLRCQLVCRRWKMLMNHVWHKKTERTLGKPFPWNDKMPWIEYYLVCTKKKPYERNLVKNPSGEHDCDYWYCEDDWFWYVLRLFPDEYVPQTELLLFDDRALCFHIAGFHIKHLTKVQTIILTDEGIHPYILDIYQPSIEVSEWYSYDWCGWDCLGEYQLRVRLFRNDDTMIDEFLFRDVQNRREWLKIAHVFKNYGPGLRRITFEHGVSSVIDDIMVDVRMAGACVCVRIP